jgi:hypothetical protein
LKGSNFNWIKGTAAPQTTTHSDPEMLGITTPGGCADPAGLPDVGLVKANTYQRGALSQVTTIVPNAVLQAGPDYFTALEITTSIAAQTRSCTCVTGSGQPSCSWSSRSTLYDGALNPAVAAQPRFSGARPANLMSSGLTQQAVSGGIIFAFDRADGSRLEYCQAACTGGSPLQPCTTPPAVANARSNNPFYAPRWDGQKVLVATRNGNALELSERDLSTTAGCASLGNVLYARLVSASVVAWRPAMFVDRPGVLYLEGTDLKAWIP